MSWLGTDVPRYLVPAAQRQNPTPPLLSKTATTNLPPTKNLTIVGAAISSPSSGLIHLSSRASCSSRSSVVIPLSLPPSLVSSYQVHPSSSSPRKPKPNSFLAGDHPFNQPASLAASPQPNLTQPAPSEVRRPPQRERTRRQSPNPSYYCEQREPPSSCTRAIRSTPR